MKQSNSFTFEISLSILNHLGRNLYRSFMTVLGEAISNSWDADACNVWISIDRENSSLIIKDDGIGMDSDDFQNKFLKIGYSKRKDGTSTSSKGRNYIGRKGIGKLAMLSCAGSITIISKKEHKEIIGGKIVNSSLDEAIVEDLTPQEYALEDWKPNEFGSLIDDFVHGTIIHFDKFNDGIRYTINYLRKSLAYYFRFSLIDDTFNIYLNDELIELNHIKELAENTQFLWIINELEDPYVSDFLKSPPLVRPLKNISSQTSMQAFIASVTKPRDLKIITTEERVTIDLFVNGRLRERDILKHIPTARIVENYLYGQIHFNELEDDVDRFTSSREGIVSDDPKFLLLLEELRTNILPGIINDWDKWRIENRDDGDPDNENISKKERKSRELFNAVAEEYAPPEDSENKEKVNEWVTGLEKDAQFNFTSYAECFISENLIRKFIRDQKIELTREAKWQILDYKKREEQNKNRGNVSVAIRTDSEDDLSYLSMDGLSNMVDKRPSHEASLSRNAKEYKPMRDAVAHTAKLTDIAKSRLTSVYENIKGRIKALLNSSLD